MTTYITATTGTDRKTIRRTIADNLQDLIVVTATANSDGSLITDQVNLVDSDGAYRNAFVLCTSLIDSAGNGNAANLGVSRRVSDSTQNSTQVNLLTSFSAGVYTGDEFELLNLRGVGFRPQDYHRAIDDAVRVLREGEHLYRTYQNGGLVFDKDDPNPAVPAAIVYLESVYYLDDSSGVDEWRMIPRAPFRDPNALGWMPLGQTGYITVQGSYFREAADGNTMRYFGYGLPNDLTDDSSLWNGPTEFIVNWASHKLAFRRGGPDWTPRAMLWWQRAQDARPRSSVPWGPNLVKIR